jgi:hypothetical protein
MLFTEFFIGIRTLVHRQKCRGKKRYAHTIWLSRFG